MAYTPPFELTNEMVDLVAEIAQKVGAIKATDSFPASPQLRRQNRIRTIHSSLAIENNSLSFDQVTAVIEGKHVLAPPHDILEVQNALAAYEQIDSFNAHKASDLLRAHRILMKGLIPNSGCYRTGDVGVFQGSDLIHPGTSGKYVAEVMEQLFEWLKDSEMHPLVQSCVFHYELEFIHPFSDGNGRMGRLWQTVILKDWNKLFEWLPIESIVKEKQQEYYVELNSADKSSDSTNFVTFMLRNISEALDKAAPAQNAQVDKEEETNKENVVGGVLFNPTNDETPGGLVERARLDDVGGLVDSSVLSSSVGPQGEKLLSLIRSQPTITMRAAAEKLNLSTRQVERLFAALKKNGIISRVGARRNGYWVIQ